MSDEIKLPETDAHLESAGYATLGILVAVLLTLPVSLPIWTYIHFIHRRPTRRIRQLFAKQLPDDSLLDLRIEKKVDKRILGQLTTRAAHLLTFEYHRELDLLTIRDQNGNKVSR